MAHINSTDPGNFASQLLKSVNEYRRRHGAKPLILNPVISEKAEKWAKHLISSRTLQHSDTVHGENIWCQQGPVSLQVTGQQVADSWYNEIKNYDFSSSGFQKNCGHFTQLVWRDSKELGVGLASDGKGLTITVAQFDPAGNITNPGYFARNVLPIGSQVVEAGGSAHRENTSKRDLPVTSELAPFSGEDSGNFAIQLLNSANKCRRSHGMPPLTLSSQISKNAEKWAEHLVTSRTLQHSDTTYGENIWCQQGPIGRQVTGQQVVDSWYNEIKDYDFSSPGFQKTCGHFTQLVWRDSRELGVGLASNGKGLTVVVAQFDPAGNISNPGYFAKNVLPVGSQVVEEKRSAHSENTRAPDAPTRTGDTSGDFPKQLLKSVNEHRRSHGVQPLTLSPSISKNAKKWAEHLVVSRTLQHSDTPHGENIWYQQGPVTLQVTGQGVAESWYNEIKKYDFSSPGFQKNCGHFTQMVWRDSKELGVGLASDGKGLIVVVAQFNPAGNITNPGYFAKNVLPVGSQMQKVEAETFHREKVKTSGYPDTKKVASASDNEKGAFIVELLKEHNRLRAQHQSPPLQVNSELSEQAQEWAEHLVDIKTLQHSGTKYGENLWYKWSSNKMLPTGTEVSQAWYKEIEEYNFDAPGFHSGTGHFTQLVWKASREIGVGIATDGKGKFIVVAVYNPPGNISNPGYFKDNVLPARKP